MWDLGASQFVTKVAQDRFFQKICGPKGEGPSDSTSEELEELAAAIVCAS